mgnify:CR=1 FL=1|jgi:hypothetical protein|tara:strand:- start:16 stop:273 length:258 start_codon:yes stop_codon:yes gene_type:complete
MSNTELQNAGEKIENFIKTIPTGRIIFWHNYKGLVRENRMKYNHRLSRVSLPNWFKRHFGLTGQRKTIERKLGEILETINLNEIK